MEGIDYNYLSSIAFKAKLVIFLGGAGVSTASGIPDFRSPSGLYNQKKEYGYDYETILSSSFFYSHTELFYKFYFDKMVFKDAKPNKAHLALSKFEKQEHHIVIITQNIDGLHIDAGSKDVIELHGTTRSYHCLSCNKHYRLDEINLNDIPRCSCGGIIKPDVVLYEEPLDGKKLNRSIELIQKADLLIVGGTSLAVEPFASLPLFYPSYKPSILINKEKTHKDDLFKYVIHDDIGDSLEKILLGE